MSEHEQPENQSPEAANIAVGDTGDLSQSDEQERPGSVNIFSGTADTVIQIQGDIDNLTL